MANDKKERKAIGTKVSALKKKRAAGKRISANDAELIREWDKGKIKEGRPSKHDSPGAPAGESPPDPVVAIPGSDPPAAGAPVDLSQPAPIPAPAPKILPARAPDDGRGAGDWRDAYKVRAEGREATCVQIAEYWVAGMKKANVMIKESGRKPFISDETIDSWGHPSAVLFFDRILPSQFEASPTVITFALTTAITVQAGIAAARGPVGEDGQVLKKGKPRGPDYMGSGSKVIPFKPAEEPQPEPRPEPSPPPPPAKPADDKPII